ncbi:MAG: TetR/AcrR family transcriptional regulator [Methyloceanibacter sp.]
MGRPRSFDRDQALNEALHVFWAKGYEGTSISDLTEAMGINPPSLYAAFGNKEKLFCEALDRYAGLREQFMEEAFAAPTAREAMARLLEGTADRLSDKSKPTGCLLVQGALSGGKECEVVKQNLAARRAAGEVMIRDRLKRAKREGDLPADADPAALACFVTTIMQGMSVQAAGGATRKELRAIADTALRAWPA